MTTTAAVIEQRRRNGLSRIQTEAHNKILDSACNCGSGRKPIGAWALAAPIAGSVAITQK